MHKRRYTRKAETAGAQVAGSLTLQPMSDLDLAIRNGWGDTPQSKLPADWRERKNYAALGLPKPGRARGAHA